MKKFVILLISLTLVLSVAGINVFAASDLTTAIRNKATIDGKISDGEYGDAFKMTAKNTFEFTTTETTLPYDISWYFAWQSDALYVAVEVPTASLKDGDTFQLNFNPGKLIPDDDNGLFFSAGYAPDGMTFSQVNWATELCDTADIKGAAIEITNKVGTSGDNTIIEMQIPLDFFKITKSSNGTEVDSSNFTLSSGVLPCDTFAVIGGAGYVIDNATGIQNADWTINGLNMATITLKGDTSDSDASSDNTAGSEEQSNSTTFDLGIVALAAVALSTVSAFKKKQ